MPGLIYWRAMSEPLPRLVASVPPPAPSPTPLLEVRSIVHAYDATQPVCRDLSFQLEPGSIACLLGPSGCGKTTVLRCIAGFEPVRSGEIVLNGRSVSRPGWSLPPEHRNVGMVFQDAALFPHLDVARNVAFGLRNLTRGERETRVAAMIDAVGLAQHTGRFPHELSGGQQQRVALARALAPQPALLLLDEPFSGLDADLRERLAGEIRTVLKGLQATAVLVTHDQHEAFAIADVIGVLGDGRLHQWDTAWNLYHHPANRFVADFVGLGTFVAGTIIAPGRIATALGEMPSTGLTQAPGSRVTVLLRPDHLVPDLAREPQLEVCDKAFKGAETLYTLRLPSGERVLTLSPSLHEFALGSRIGVRLDVAQVTAFPVE